MTDASGPTGRPTPPPGEVFVQSLARGLAVITAFDADHGELTLSQVATRTGLSRATARRLLLTLAELGYVRSRAGRFALTPQVLRLGTAYLSGIGLPQVAQPHLERLSAEVGESTSAAVLDGTDIVYVSRVATRRLMTVGITVGTRFPAYATSMGRVLLAALPPENLNAHLAVLAPLTDRTLTDRPALDDALAAVREQGWALVDQELEAGLRSLAAPVTGADGQVVAAVNVSMSALGDPRPPTELVPALTRTAAAISADLGLTG